MSSKVKLVEKGRKPSILSHFTRCALKKLRVYRGSETHRFPKTSSFMCGEESMYAAIFQNTSEVLRTFASLTLPFQFPDNWEKLVVAVLDRQKYRELALAPSRETSFGSSFADSEFDLDLDLDINDIPAIPINEIEAIIDSFYGKPPRSKEIRHGVLKSGRLAAIKYLNLKPSDQEFMSQVSKISSIKHENVIELLGYCIDVRVLAYEYAPSGSLHDILHGKTGKTGSVLSWDQRVEIAIGVAKGLQYLHTRGHVHGHIKSTNILLFGNVAKVTDLHCPKSCHKLVSEGDPLYFHPSHTACSSGYAAPEYLTIGQMTLPIDIYSFGVVLLELLTGCKAVDHILSRGSKRLSEWVKPFISNKDKVERIVDVELKGDYPIKAAKKMAAIADSCLHYEAEFRPEMSVVVKALQRLVNTS